MLIFSGSSNKNLAKKVAKQLRLSLSEIEIHTFPDKENRVRVIDKVLDQDVVVVQSTGVSPNRYYMELFFILDSLKRSGARSVTLVVPYLGYQRQDHIFRSGEAVSLEVIVNLIKTLKVDKVISFDLHSLRIEEFFKTKRIKLSHLSALSVFAKEIEKMFARGPVSLHPRPTSSSSSAPAGARRGSPALTTPRESAISHEPLAMSQDVVLVSPDMGGIRRIQLLAKLLGNKIPCISIEKNRDLNTGEVKSTKVNGEVKKRAIIVDDVISTGKTLISAADLLKKNGAEEIYVMATHGIFAGDGPKDLEESIIKKVIVSDTIEIRNNRRFNKLEVLSISKPITDELRKNG